jgi:hypothetical protein
MSSQYCISFHITGPLKEALKGTDVRFGIYHAMIEWFNPIWLTDQANNFTTQRYVKVSYNNGWDLPVNINVMTFYKIYNFVE